MKCIIRVYWYLLSGYCRCKEVVMNADDNRVVAGPCAARRQDVLAQTLWMRKRDLALHLGEGVSWEDSPPAMDLGELMELRAACGVDGPGARVYFQAEDHFLRSRIEPFQAMFTTWMNGAKAQVQGRDVPFTQVITWCQDAGDNEARKTLSEEVRRLCRFLAPFSHATWEALLALLDELGYRDYISYCEIKKGVCLAEQRQRADEFLEETRGVYFPRISSLLEEVTGLELSRAHRFDAIYLLGLRYLDHLFPSTLDLEGLLEFFHAMGLPVKGNPALKVHLEGIPGRQSYCIPVDIPGEVHVVAGPVRGWLDLESVLHEMGHALGFLFTDPGLPPEDKDFFQSGALSEAFAFLFQKMGLSPLFLERFLGLDPPQARIVSEVHATKWLALARRYAAKFVIEEENFRKGRLSRGQEYYAEIMARGTGFRYDPETYLFDLMPDFYSLDYFQAYIGAAAIWNHLEASLGEEWLFLGEAGRLLRGWWKEGNRLDLETFLKEELGLGLDVQAFARSLSG